eukprot:Seg5139.3 transcript_id=Seg5139.3/GoldUCD/mRNA.D3Y31 product="hypothetical protein" protein_id=Seg5139.3/GoldUCD/D3Y31
MHKVAKLDINNYFPKPRSSPEFRMTYKHNYGIFPPEVVVENDPMQDMRLSILNLTEMVTNLAEQENYDHKDNAATPGSVDDTGFEETETIDSVVTTTPENNNPQDLDQYDGEELHSVEFDKEVFLEEVRKYRCLWDIASEGYKIRPVKQTHGQK